MAVQPLGGRYSTPHCPSWITIPQSRQALAAPKAVRRPAGAEEALTQASKVHWGPGLQPERTGAYAIGSFRSVAPPAVRLTMTAITPRRGRTLMMAAHATRNPNVVCAAMGVNGPT